MTRRCLGAFEEERPLAGVPRELRRAPELDGGLAVTPELGQEIGPDKYARAVDYRIDPTPLTRRRSRRVLMVTAGLTLATVVIVTALAFLGRPPSEVASVPSATGTAQAAVTASDPPGAATVPPATGSARSTPTLAPAVASGPPPHLDCHDVPATRCAAIERAVIVAVADPVLPYPTKVDIWASLLCSNTFDCPPGRMEDRRPAGSAVVLAGSTWLWVNVTDALGPSGPGTLSAWVIRSGPIG